MALRRIIAICVVRSGATVAAETLEAIGAQTLPVDVTVAVELGSSDQSVGLSHAAGVDLAVQLPAKTGFGAAVEAALDRVRLRDAETLGAVGAEEAAGDDWIWVLSQDNAPHPDALRALIHEAEVSPSVGVIGPKLVRPTDHQRLIEFGQTLTATGATVHLAAGELDQGQFAKQSDVLGVAASGMLVKRSIWQELDGLDPALPNVDAGLDFSIRTRLAGHRVVVAPDARVEYQRKYNLFSKKGSNLTAIRRAQLHRRLSYSSALLLPFVWLLMLPEALVRGVLVLLNKQPQRVIPEIAAALGAMFSFGSIFSSRRRFHRSKKHGMGSLDSLRRSVAESRRVNALGRENFREQRRGNISPTQFMFGGGALTILILLSIGIVAYGTFWGSNHLFGGGASPLGDLVDLWRNALWYPDVFEAPNDPFNLILAVLGSLTFWNPSYSLVLLYVLALPIAGLGAWFFVAKLEAGQLTRTAVAFIWALAPMHLSALAEGRIGPIVFHLLLPWLALAAQAASRSVGAAGGAAILLLFTAAAAPSATPLLIICWVVLLFWQVKRSYRIILIPAPAVIAFAPLVLFHLSQGSFLSVLADPGLALQYVAALPWELALGLPEAGFGGWYAWFSAFEHPALFAGILLAVLYAAFGIAAISSLLSKRFMLAVSALSAALMGFLATLAISQLNITNIGTEPLAIWPGSTLSFYWFGLAVAFAIGVGKIRVGLVQVLALSGSVLAVIPLLLAPLLGNALVVPNGRVLPAIVAASAADNPNQGTLIIRPQFDGALQVELVRGVGDRLDQQRTIDYVLQSQTEAELQTEIEQIAVNLVSGIGQNAERLAELEVHYVLMTQVPGESAGFGLYIEPNATRSAEITANYLTGLNSVFELNPVGETSVGQLWALDITLLEETSFAVTVAEAEPSEGADRLWSYALIGILALAILLSIPSRRTAPAGVDAGDSRQHPDTDRPEPPITDDDDGPGALGAELAGADVTGANLTSPEHTAAMVTVDTGSVTILDLDAEAAARDADREVYGEKRRNPIALASQSVITLIALGTAVVTVGGASLISLPQLDLNANPAVSVTPTADSRKTVCAPSFLNYGIAQGSSEVSLRSLGTAPNRTVASMLTDDASNGLAGISPLNQSQVAFEYPGTSPLALTPADAAQSPHLLYSAAQSHSVSTERVSGFLASECVETRTEGWLLGGSTATGRSTVLVLVNPNPVATTIELVMHGELGRVTSTGVTLPAESTYAISLAALSPNTLSPVVQVTSRGGPVAGFLAESVTRVLNPGGVEQVGFAGKASTEQTIPLMQLYNQAYVSELAGESAQNDARPSVRIFNPNAEFVIVEVEILHQSVTYEGGISPDSDGHNHEGEGDGLHQVVAVQVPPLTSIDHYLPSLADGVYSLTVRSDLPIITAARGSNPQLIEVPSANPDTPPRIEYSADFDWSFAGQPLFGQEILAIAEGPGAKLSLTSRSDEAATVLLSGDAVQRYLASGASLPAGVTVDRAAGIVSVELAAGEQRVLAVDAGELQLDGLSDTLLAVGYHGSAQLGSYTVSERRAPSEAIWVY